jgi:hypothetical protein
MVICNDVKMVDELASVIIDPEPVPPPANPDLTSSETTEGETN